MNESHWILNAVQQGVHLSRVRDESCPWCRQIHFWIGFLWGIRSPNGACVSSFAQHFVGAILRNVQLISKVRSSYWNAIFFSGESLNDVSDLKNLSLLAMNALNERFVEDQRCKCKVRKVNEQFPVLSWPMANLKRPLQRDRLAGFDEGEIIATHTQILHEHVLSHLRKPSRKSDVDADLLRE